MFYFILGINIWWKVPWSKRKRTGANTAQKYEDTGQKYNLPLPEAWHGPCQHVARPCPSPGPVLLLFFKPKLPCCNFTDLPL